MILVYPFIFKDVGAIILRGQSKKGKRKRVNNRLRIYRSDGAANPGQDFSQSIPSRRRGHEDT
jgi:hypothetical protein